MRDGGQACRHGWVVGILASAGRGGKMGETGERGWSWEGAGLDLEDRSAHLRDAAVGGGSLQVGGGGHEAEFDCRS